MLAAQATSCLYLEYTVQKTNVRVVPYDPVWLEAAIGEEPTAVAGPGAAASGPTTGGGALRGGCGLHSRLLELTKAGCERAKVVVQFESVRGRDARQFV
ncbi:hypothetical protein GPECTOR_122g452 [Gonium pectorale]|uniref:Uncharacterized protein n=1 Tax=Gonium pectorale TaxID=33097 RepID=A0A150FYM9_GONPE|nr:hypothetical protein GPECTOR_122g452 [Gonium pectorale]|eukprot:KXZ42711.1 hypothetical protein GPECTOR_122g452 [Gonium pectorale]